MNIAANKVKRGDVLILSDHDYVPAAMGSAKEIEVKSVRKGGDCIFINATKAQVECDDADLDLLEFDGEEIVRVRRTAERR